MQTKIDCSFIFTEPIQEQSNKPLSKIVRAFPTDFTGDCNTIFLYCDLVQNEIETLRVHCYEPFHSMHERLLGANSNTIIELLAIFHGNALSSLALSLSRFRSAMKLATQSPF